MFITVKLLKGFVQPLTYTVPQDWNIAKLIGAIVEVPLRTKTVPALVIDFQEKLADQPTFTIKTALKIYSFPADPLYHQFIDQASSYYALEPIYWFKRIRQFLTTKEVTNETVTTDLITSNKQLILTAEQQSIVSELQEKIDKKLYYPALLHGVTGSGKTEIYKKLIERTFQAGKSVLLLLPEVTLAVQFTALLQQQLSANIPVMGFHSATNTQEKSKVWKSLLKNEPMLIIGVHLPILLPIAQLGLIIIDEEHEVGFQEKKHPKINTKELAILRAQLYKIPILLGSATPSLSTLYTAQKKNWLFFSLHKRFKGTFPTISLVQLKENKARKNFWISNELYQAIEDRLHKKEQIIIFLNRRGYSFFIQCKKCGFIFSCPNCSVSLTLHENNFLSCHYCGNKQQEPTACSACKADKYDLLKKGIGTQQLVTILQNLFPKARIARADLDSTVNKKKWQQTVKEFEAGTLDILVGTQTITKGYNFPKVTLVGIIWADLNLNFPIYNAAETTLQQLIQVAGRAGRQTDKSLVIVQTMLEHDIFNYLNEEDYLNFYDKEILLRELVGYPPCIRLAEIELRHKNETVVEKESIEIFEALSGFVSKNKLSILLLGPACPPVSKIKNIYMRKIYLKSNSIQAIYKAWNFINHNTTESKLFFTPNPLS